MFFCLILPSLASLHFLSLIWCGYKLSDLSPFGKIILFLSVVFIHIYLLFTHIYNIYIYGFSLSLQPHMLHGLLETRGMSVAICLCRLAPPHIHAQGITRHWIRNSSITHRWVITCPNLMIFIVANLNKAIPCNSYYHHICMCVCVRHSCRDKPDYSFKIMFVAWSLAPGLGCKRQ